MGFTVCIYGWFLPENHNIYKNYKQSIRNANIIELTSEIKTLIICEGVNLKDDGNIKPHVIQRHYDPLLDDYVPYSSKTFYRQKCCDVLSIGTQCEVCNDLVKKGKNQKMLNTEDYLLLLQRPKHQCLLHPRKDLN